MIIYEEFHCPFPVTSVGEESVPQGNGQVELHSCEGSQVEDWQKCLFSGKESHIHAVCVCV